MSKHNTIWIDTDDEVTAFVKPNRIAPAVDFRSEGIDSNINITNNYFNSTQNHFPNVRS